MERLSREPGRNGLSLFGKMLDGLGLKSLPAPVTRLNLTDPPGYSETPIDAGVRVNEGSVLALSAAWACVNLIAGTIASLPLMVYRKDRQGNLVVASDHTLYRVLHDSPNTDQTAMDFWEGGIAALELRGNMHARQERIGDRVVALVPIFNPDVRRDRNGIIRYRWIEDGKSYDEPQENVFHVRGFGGSPLGGLSPLSYGRQVFGLATAVNRAASATFANGIRPSLALTMPEGKTLAVDQRDALERALQEKHAGAMNAGRPLLLEAGITPHHLSFSPEDAQMLESRAFSVEEVCRFFDVPPHMVGHTEKSTSWGTGLEQQTLGFQKFTLRRRLKRIEQAVEKQLLTPADRAAGVTIEFNLEGLLRGDSVARFSSYQTGLQNGIYTINEVRAIEGLAPVEGGDLPRMQMQNVPITQSGQTPALPAS